MYTKNDTFINDFLRRPDQNVTCIDYISECSECYPISFGYGHLVLDTVI